MTQGITGEEDGVSPDYDQATILGAGYADVAWLSGYRVF